LRNTIPDSSRHPHGMVSTVGVFNFMGDDLEVVVAKKLGVLIRIVSSFGGR